MPPLSLSRQIKSLRVSLQPTLTEIVSRKAKKVRFYGKGISQSELAKRIGVLTRTVQSWEQGRNVSGPAKMLFEEWATAIRVKEEEKVS